MSSTKQVAELVEPFAGKPSELIQALHRVQSKLGYVPVEAQDEVAGIVGVSPAQVYGVLTFYHFFRTEPCGRHVIRLCMGTACHVRGADRVLQALTDELKVGLGGSTDDGMFTLEGVRCLGACGLAPVMMVDDEVHGRLDPSKARAVIREYRKQQG